MMSVTVAIRLRAIGLSLLVAVVVAACQPEGRIFQTTLRTEFTDPLPVAFTDQTGLVTGITQAAADPAAIGNAPAVRAAQGDPNGLVLTWLGGACDQDTAARLHVLSGGNVVLNVSVHEKLGLGCTAAGVPRAIRITTSGPIPVDSITVAGG